MGPKKQHHNKGAPSLTSMNSDPFASFGATSLSSYDPSCRSYDPVAASRGVGNDKEIDSAIAGGVGLPCEVYQGSDAEIRAAMKGIVKKDKTTRIKSMHRLESCAFAERGCGQGGEGKHEARQALNHFAYLFIRLSNDNDASVRSRSLSTLHSASLYIPKAFSSLLSSKSNDVLARVYMLTCDPSKEVSTIAASLISNVFDAKSFRSSGALPGIAKHAIRNVASEQREHEESGKREDVEVRKGERLLLLLL